MPTPDFLRDLPSVKELLEHPQVQSVTDRLNRSVVATRVRGFLDELKDQVQKRSADMPGSLREVAERVSRYVLRGDAGRVGAAINATGRFRGGAWASAPLSEAAIERVMLSVHDYSVGQGEDCSTLDALRRAAGAPAAAVFHNRTGALWLALLACAKDGAAVVSRSDLAMIDPGCRVTDLFATLPVELREVGAADGVSVGDYEAALHSGAKTILRVAAEEHRMVGADDRPSTEELVSLVKSKGAVLIEDLGSAPLMSPPELNDQPIAGIEAKTAAEALAAGANLVLVRGDGLVGGPACAILLGDAELIERIHSHPMAAAHRASPRVVAALGATVEQLGSSGAAFDIPLWSQLSTPIENLLSRAERLAPQLVQSPLLAEASVRQLTAAESPIAGVPVRLPSVAIALSPVDGDLPALESHLKHSTPPVQGRVVEGKLLLDLRTVFPRQDLQLAEVFAPAEPIDSQGQ